MSTTKKEMIEAVASGASIPRTAARDAIDAFVSFLANSLKSGNSVHLTGIGKFGVRHRPARTGINPRDPSVKVQIPAKEAVYFKASKSIKDFVNS